MATGSSSTPRVLTHQGRHGAVLRRLRRQTSSDVMLSGAVCPEPPSPILFLPIFTCLSVWRTDFRQASRVIGPVKSRASRAHMSSTPSLPAVSPWLGKCQASLTMEKQLYLYSPLFPILKLKMSYNPHHSGTKAIGDARFSQSFATEQTFL